MNGNLFNRVFSTVVLSLLLSGLLSSCSNLYYIKLKPDEELVVTKKKEAKSPTPNNADEDNDDQDVSGGERETHYFGQSHDLMQGGHTSTKINYNYDVILGLGFTKIYGDLNRTEMRPVYRLAFDRYLNKHVTLGLAFRHGAFAEYEDRNSWTDGLQVYNEFTSICLNTRVALSAFSKPANNKGSRILHGIYAGVGAGLIFSNVSSISSKFRQQDPKLISQIFPSSINTGTSIFYIPLNIGINIPIKKRFFFNYNLQFGYTFSDDLDGYNFQGGVKNKYNDMFSMMSIGIGYRFGRVKYVTR